MAALSELLGPVHNSHLVAARRCEKKFEYSYIRNIQAKRPSLPLARGIWIHYCLEAQYLRWGLEDKTLLTFNNSINIDGVGKVLIDEDSKTLVVEDENETFTYPLTASGMLELLTAHVWGRLFPQEHEKYTENGYTLPQAVEKILTEYFYFYRDEFINREFKVLLVEADWRRSYKDIEFEGRIDTVIEDKSGLIVCRDWKSTKQEPSAEYKFMESQLHLYPWGVAPQLVEAGIPSDAVENMAVEFDYLSTVLPTKPSQNKNGALSVKKINTTYLTLMEALKEYGLKWSKTDIESFLDKNEKTFFSRKRMPRNKRVVKNLLEENVSDARELERLLIGEKTPTRTVNKNCAWDCDFLPLCKADLYGQDVRNIMLKEFEARTNTHSGTEVEDE